MSKNKSKNLTPRNGFEALMDTHTKALKGNSDEIVEILEILSEKSLVGKYKEDLRKLNKELNSIDKRIDLLGKVHPNINSQESIGEDWFEL